MTLTKKAFTARLKKIKILLTDIDGVLTDGGMYYTEEGMVMKKFFVRDGMGTSLLHKAGFKTGIISTDVSPIANVRGERLKMDFIYLGVWEKDKALEEICKAEKISFEHVAFIGDDVNDIEIVKKVGVAVCPKDASDEIKKLAHYICKKKGGNGAYREIVDLILHTNVRKDDKNKK